MGTILTRRAAGAMAAGLLIVIATARPAPGATDGPRVNLEMKNFAFAPAKVTVRAGQTLVWTNDDVVPHTATADRKAWDSGQVAPGHSFTVRITAPGTYAYTCLNHPFMRAKVVVLK